MRDLSSWPRGEELLDRVLELPADRRQDFLEREIDDPDLRAVIEELLIEDEGTGFLEPGGVIGRPVFRDLESTLEESEPHPERIGPYRVLELIGRGGMARVFRAERCEGGFEQHVALKLVRPGGDRDLSQRFAAERQILAQLQHPSIARLLDGGQTEDGQPWFAMELIEGQSIETHCRDHDLGLRDRLRLFVEVAEAVAYAHRNLVVHRDLKSSNVLVTASGEVKLLDFGIAKLVEPQTAQETATHHRLLTPEFASPEQLTGEPITTASDVYQLGHLLYRLVTGRSPYEGRTTTPAYLQEAILSDTPAIPSQAASTAADNASSPAREWSRLLRGDLDAIVMKALRKEQERRYSTVRALIDDVEAHLDGRPVEARPDSVGYRLRRFVARHRVPVAVAAIAAMALLALSILFLVRLTEERDRARREARTATEIADFLTELFRISDPSVARGNSVTARELLDRAAEQIDDELEAEPEVRAALLDTMGIAYRELGLFEPADRLLTAALDQHLALHGADHPGTFEAKGHLGTIRWRQGRFEEAAELQSEALEGSRRLLGPEHPESLSHAANLALAWWRLGRHQEASDLFESTLASMVRIHGDEHRDTASVRDNLAGVYWTEGRYGEAARIYAETLDVNRRVRGPDHSLSLRSLYNLALATKAQGHYEEAEPLFVEAVERRRRVFGTDHPGTLGAVSGLASLYAQTGRLEEAEELHRELLEARRRVLGATHLQTLGSLQNLGGTLWLLGMTEEAEGLLRENLELRRQALGAENPQTLYAAATLAKLLAEIGRDDEAESLYRSTLEVYQQTQGASHRNTLEVMRDLGRLLCTSGSASEGEALVGDAVERAETALSTELLLLGTLATERGHCLTALGRLDEARSALTRADDLLERAELSDPEPMERARLVRTDLERSRRSQGERP